MISAIFGYITNKDLSLGDKLAMMAAVVIGVLFSDLQLQRARLHKAQIDLLDAQTKPQEAQAASAVISATESYQTQLKDFLQAGGVLMLVLCIAAGPAWAENTVSLSSQLPPAPLIDKCEHTLRACDTVVNFQQSQINILLANEKLWRDKAIKSESPFLPDWAWFVAGTVLATGVWGVFYYQKGGK